MASRPAAAVLARACLVSPIKAFEHVWDSLGSDPDAVIRHVNAQIAAGGFELYRNLAARRRVPDRVIEQVQYQSPDKFLISAKVDIFRTLAVQTYVLLSGYALDGPAAFAQQVIQIKLCDA